MSAPTEKPPDQDRIVAFLARQSRRPVAEIAALYEHERAALAPGARVKKFVHIFAIRNVQEILRRRSAVGPGPPAGDLRQGEPRAEAADAPGSDATA